MYVVFLTQLESVDRVVAALRSSGDIGNMDLANGIENNLHYMDEKGLHLLRPVEKVPSPKRVQ